MEKIKYLVLVFFVAFSSQFGLAQEEVTASNATPPSGFSASNDTLANPSKLRSGEIMGLENADRSLKLEGTKEKKKADKLYRDLGFQASTRAYQSLSRREKKSEKVLSRIANSHRLNHNTEEAEYWYAKFINNTNESKHLLHYAQVLKSNGKCEDAVRWFNEYKEVATKKDLKNRTFNVNCEETAFANHLDVEIYNVENINTSHLDFSPIPFNDGIVFTSSRGRDQMTKNTDKWTNDNFTDLFFAKMNEDGTFTKPVPFIGDVNGKYHDGTASFNEGQSVMVFTRNNLKGKSENGLIDLKIYSANSDDEYWVNSEELPFNSNEYSTCHPALTSNGRTLYFTSNRPGGYGGMDIYISTFEGGDWSTPKNLGPTVNSSGNEIFPFISEAGDLYYSSNGHSSLGGLDIFKATKANADDEDSWIYRENMGKPFNSKKDDFGFYINKDQTMGFLSSSRKGGAGKDDIYSWKLKSGAPDSEATFANRAICVYEEGTDRRVEKASVMVTEKAMDRSMGTNNGDMILTLKPLNEDNKEFVLGITKPSDEGNTEFKNFWTNDKGIFNYTKVQRNKQYEVVVEKNGFITKNITVNSMELWENKEYCIPIAKRNCMALNGIVKNKEYNMAMPGAKVKILDKCSGEETETITGEDGTFDYCLKCGCEYRIRATKPGFDEDYEFINTVEIECDANDSMAALLELGTRKTEVIASTSTSTTTPPPPPVAMVPVVTYETVITYQPVTTVQPVTTYVPANQLSGANLSEHFLGDANANFSEGQLITLNDVYYDFDKFNIRADASTDLERVIKLMQTYPSMSISLESHTDARGNNAYNKNLSQNRALSARKYIISRGIDASRVTAKGFGEGTLKNKCADGVKCSEQEHQQNRRTEVRIMKFNEPGVQYNKQ